MRKNILLFTLIFILTFTFAVQAEVLNQLHERDLDMYIVDPYEGSVRIRNIRPKDKRPRRTRHLKIRTHNQIAYLSLEHMKHKTLDLAPVYEVSYYRHEFDFEQSKEKDVDMYDFKGEIDFTFLLIQDYHQDIIDYYSDKFD